MNPPDLLGKSSGPTARVRLTKKLDHLHDAQDLYYMSIPDQLHESFGSIASTLGLTALLLG
jgi:hypothetical protein